MRLVVRLVARLAALAAVASFVPAALAQEEHLHYPVPAAAFRDRVLDHEAKARARLEAYIVEQKVERAKADALRARFQAAVAQVDAKVDEACADGTVTGEEARAVHALASELRRRFHEGG